MLNGGLSTGAIAQLGERLLCTQEVGGSIPPSSTNFQVVVFKGLKELALGHTERLPCTQVVGAGRAGFDPA